MNKVIHTEHGTVVRYAEDEAKTGRWAGRGTVTRVYWRSIPNDPEQAIGHHLRRRDAIAALTPEPKADDTPAPPAATPQNFSAAQLIALNAMEYAGPNDDQSWIRANTLNSLAGLWWEQRGIKYLTGAGRAAFEAAGGSEAADTAMRTLGGPR